MKIAVFSDIHGNLEVLEAIIASINKKNITLIYTRKEEKHDF